MHEASFCVPAVVVVFMNSVLVLQLHTYVTTDFPLKYFSMFIIPLRVGWHHPPRLISYYLAGKKKSQNKNFDNHITTI
jgi:hypothetical protein